MADESDQDSLHTFFNCSKIKARSLTRLCVPDKRDVNNALLERSRLWIVTILKNTSVSAKS